MTEIIAEDVVIGSGPTGWAACMGIWSRGGRPLVIDIGYTTNSGKGESVIRNPTVKSKTLFGSEHMYKFPLKELQLVPPEGVIPLSGALGGLSTVWGAGIQPVSAVDLASVPDEVRQSWLHSSTELLKKMDFLGRNDLLSRRDPWPIDPQDQVVTSTRFQRILDRADSNQTIGLQKVLYGSPRLAIVGSGNPEKKGACVLCGQCMSGCPENSIFDSGQAIREAILKFGGSYLRGTVVNIGAHDQHAESRATSVEVVVHDADGKTVRVKTSRLYVGAGAIGTPILLQKSGLAPGVVDVRDSQMFYGAFASIDKYKYNKLAMSTSQGYFSTSSAVDPENEFSMSVYEYSDDFRIRLVEMVPDFVKPLIPISTPIIKRILPGIGFLSQDVSGSIRLNFDGAKTTISLLENTLTNNAIHSAMKLIGKTSRRIGLYPIPNPFAIPSVGAGFHAGASMPMGGDSNHLVDWEGKLKALPSIRIVDATSLMRIKAGSHTFMAMANAHRIASR